MSSNFSFADATPDKPERTPDYVRGQVLRGKYELLRPLDSGGMGVVWVARDRVLNVEVALKLIERPASERPEFTRRALSEARLAAKLAHPAVCRAVDFGVSERGDPFVVSELLTGETLEERIVRAGSMEPVEAVQMLLPILDALRAAHELGIVHRDVKPGNIFLAKQWSQGIQPKLLDFGIARWVDEGAAASDGICGTPCYMSPEQASGADVDARSDLWNFCATLYELVTGVPPFDGDSRTGVIAAVQCVDPPPITHFHAGDDELAAIIARGMHRDREERWSCAEELTTALSRWLLARGVETDGSGRSLRARLGEAQSAAAITPAAPSSLAPGVSDVKVASPSTAPRLPQARFWLGMLAGAALVFPLTTFQVLRAANEAEAASPEPQTAALPIAAAPPQPSVTPGEPVVASLALTQLASTQVTPITTESKVAKNEPSPPPKSQAGAPPPPPRTAASGSAAPVASPAAPSAPPVVRSEKPAKRPSNALGYDFGF